MNSTLRRNGLCRSLLQRPLLAVPKSSPGKAGTNGVAATPFKSWHGKACLWGGTYRRRSGDARDKKRKEAYAMQPFITHFGESKQIQAPFTAVRDRSTRK
jgi:hypothetical protein